MAKPAVGTHFAWPIARPWKTCRFPLGFSRITAPYMDIANTSWWSIRLPLVPVDSCIGLAPRMPGAEPQATPSLAIWRQVDTFILHVSGAAKKTMINLLQFERLSGMRGHPRFQAAKEIRLSLARALPIFGLLPLAWDSEQQRTWDDLIY